MIFSSMEFVCVFLPAVFLLHCLAPGIRGKNLLLMVASLLFYAYGEPVYVLLMACSAGFSYLAAHLVAPRASLDSGVNPGASLDSGVNPGASAGLDSSASPDKRYRKWLLFAAIALNLSLLAFFKYAAFFLENVNQLMGMELEMPEISLPVGISFFTFQALSYVFDVYYGRVQVEKNFGRVLLYIAFFPQLVAGPIVKYRDVSQALEGRRLSLGQASAGMRRFICGLGKKVLIANTVGQAADAIFGAPYAEIGTCAAWIGAAAYMLQIYYDFSGYSDMAIGLGQMFGFQFQENFNYPYSASTIKDFWRRWHISLSSWFREYLYIPLGGNRRGKVRTGFNRLAVFFLTGLWHGANWTFIIWGLYHGLLASLEDLLPFVKKIPKAITWLPTLLAVCVGFVIFRADTISQGVFFLHQMFAFQPLAGQDMTLALRQLTPWFLTMAAVGVAGMAPIRPLAGWIKDTIRKGEEEASWKTAPLQAALNIGSLGILLWCLVRLSAGTYNPFIYFRF